MACSQVSSSSSENDWEFSEEFKDQISLQLYIQSIPHNTSIQTNDKLDCDTDTHKMHQQTVNVLLPIMTMKIM